jgi:hypothetical protein
MKELQISPKMRVDSKRRSMSEHKAHPANVPGDFYVEDGCCTMCLVPFSEAPELFGERKDPKGYSHCFVKRQPETQTELTKMLNAIRCAELMCIRYRGADRRIQLQLVEAETGVVCDKLPPDLQQRVDEQEAKTKGFLEAWQAAHGTWPQPKKPWWRFWS